MIYLFDLKMELLGEIGKAEIVEADMEEKLGGEITASVTFPFSLFDSNTQFFGFSRKGAHYLFKITHDEKIDNNISLKGIHIFFDDLQGRILRDNKPREAGAQELLDLILKDTGWEARVTGINTTLSTNFYYKSALECFSKIQEFFRFEFRPELTYKKGKLFKKIIYVSPSIGSYRGKWYEYGDKLVKVVAEENRSQVFTAFVGHGKGVPIKDESGNETGGVGRKIDFSSLDFAGNADVPIIKPAGQDFVEIQWAKDKYGYGGKDNRFTVLEFSDIEDQEELLKATYWAGLEYCRPKLQLKTTVFDPNEAEIGEICTIIRPDLNIRYQQKIFLIKTNLITGTQEIDFGDQLVTTRADQIRSLKKADLDQKEEYTSYITQVTDAIEDLWRNDDGYNYDLKAGNKYGLPGGFYSFDRPIDENPTKVVGISAGRLVISNKKNPETGAWDFRTFGTGDGFYADLIVAGMLKGGNVTWNLETGELNIANKFWYHPSNGLLELSDGIISGKNGSWDLGSGYFETWYNGSLVRIYNGELSVFKNSRLMNVMNGNGYFVYNNGALSGKIISDGFIGSSSNFNIFHSSGNSLTIGYNGEASGNGFNTYVIFDKGNNSGWMYGGAAITFYEPTRFNTKVIINGELDGNVITQINGMITDKTDKLDNQIFQLEQSINKKIDSHTWSLQSHQQQINNLSSAVSDLKRRVANLGG